MPTPLPVHPDRRAATLLQVLRGGERPAEGASELPEPGSADCRIDLKQLIYRARSAIASAPSAAQHLAPLKEELHPDLWSGTVPDGVARGFAARLEEACSLASDPVSPDAPEELVELVEGKELRRKKDFLVAAGKTRARFSRKGGLLLIDRSHDLHSENCLWFEARRDLGTLDSFAGAPDEGPRLFSAQFLKPVQLACSEHTTTLTLAGTLGNGEAGWACRVSLYGDRRCDALHMTIELPRIARGWRLRSRLLGVPDQLAHHECEPVRERVDGPRGGFLADTLVRSCAQLRVGDQLVATPAAADPGPLVHRFCLGAR